MNIQGKSCSMPLASAFRILHPLGPLHGVEPGAGTPLWLRWNLDPLLLLGIALFAAAYLYGIGPYRRRRGLPPVSGWRVAAFDAGTVIFALALVSPLDTISDDYLFSAHMIQHMLIALVAPPLWLLGTPGWLLEPLFHRPAVARVARLLTNPIVAFALFNGDLWLWHIPPLYDATLQSEAVHVFEHLTFVGTAVLFWWAVLSPVRAVPRIAPGFGVLYLFIACQPMVALGALLTFASVPLYQPYVDAPRLWGSTPLGDQQLGGLIMWLPSTAPYLIGASILFFRWVGIQDHAERTAAGEFDEPPPEPVPPLEPNRDAAVSEGGMVSPR
jgi:putative membrane protein